MGGGPNGTGGRPLFILTIEDDPVDHELVIRILERSGIPVRLRTAETLEAFGAALDETMPDVVISDYNLRGFTGMEAFALLRRRDPDVPFILLTGSLDEATAVECMKAGVDDYVLKARLESLPRAVLGAAQLGRSRRAGRTADRALLKNEARLEVLLRLQNAPFDDEKSFVARALEEAVRLTDSEVGYFHFMEGDQVNLRLFCWSSAVLDRCELPREGRYPLAEAGAWADCIRLGRPVIHNDYQNLPDRRGLPEGHFPVRRHMSVAVKEGEGVRLIAGVGNKDAPYDEADARQLQLFMNSLWTILKGRRAEVLVSARSFQQTTLALLGEMALKAPPFQELLDAAVLSVARTLGVRFAGVLARRPGVPELEMVAGEGWERDLVGRAVASAEPGSLAAYVLSVRDPVVVEDLATETRFAPSAQLAERGAVSGVCVRIGPGETPYGILEVHHDAPRVFLPEDVAFVQSVANLLGSAVERGRARARIEESEATFRALTDTTASATFVYDRERFLFVNRASERLTGYSPERLVGMRFLDLVHPEDRDMVGSRAAERLSGTEVASRYEFRIVTASGETRWVDFTAGIIPFQGARAGLGTAFDITDRKSAEVALQASEEKFRTVFEHASDAVFLMRGDTFVDCNLRTLEMFGCRREDVIGAKPDRFSPPRQADGRPTGVEVRARIARILEGERMTFEWTHCRLDGTPFPAEVSLSRVVIGGEVFIHAIVRDTTERKASEAALRESKELLSAFIERSPIYAFIKEVTPEGSRVVAASENYAGMVGLPGSKMVGMTMQDLFPAEFADKITADDRAVVSAGKVLRLDEDLGDRHYTTVKFPITLGGRTLLAGYTIDITERKRVEESLRHLSERLELATTAAGMGVWDWDVANDVLVWDDQMFALYGIAREDFGGAYEAWLNGLHPEDRDASFVRTQEALRGERDYDTEFRVVWPDGSVHTLKAYGKVTFGADGRPERMTGVNFDVTEERRAEEAQRESEARFRLLYERSPVPYQSLDEEGRLIEVNESWLEMMGYREHEVVGRPMESFIAPEQAPLFRVRFPEFKARGELHGAEFTLVAKDGRRVSVSVEGRIAHDTGGSFRQTHCVLHNITERKRAEEAIRESEARFRAFVEHSREAVCVFDPASGKVLDANPAFCSLLGHSQEELASLTLYDVVADDRKGIRRLTDAIVARKSVEIGERLWRRKDGTTVPVMVTASLVARSGGDAVFVQGYDLTHIRQTEQALQESEARHRALFENSPVGMYRTTPDGQVLEANPTLLNLLGYAKLEELTSRNLEEEGFEAAYPREVFKETMERDGEVRGLEAAWRRRDGRVLYLRESARAVRDESGRILYYDGAIEDVTARREAERARRLLSTTVEQAQEAVIITDPQGSILYVNEAFTALTGYSAGEALGHNPRILKSGEQPAKFYEEMWTAILAGEVWTGRVVNKRKSGERYVAELKITPVRDEAGAVTAFTASQRDVTEEEALQARLQRAKSLETIGMVAGGMAHEVRNPLFAISTVAAALEKKYGDHEGMKPFIAHIQDHVKRLSDLMNDLLALGRPVETKRFAPCDLAAVLRDAAAGASVSQPHWKGRVKIRNEARGASVSGQRDRLVQVFSNLIQNALHFSTHDTPVRVTLKRKDGWVEAAVRDAGPGLAEDFLPRLFQPFASRRQGGTGLGLALVRKLVEEHGGTVEGGNNARGPGAVFTVRLPLVKGGSGE